MLTRLLLGFGSLTALLWLAPPGAARADVPPRWGLLSQQPVPRDAYGTPAYDLRGPTAPLEEPYPDAGTGVALVTEHSTAELYPTLVRVRSRLTFRGGEGGAEGLVVGFPESLYGLFPRPPEELTVTVNGGPVAVEDSLPTDAQAFVIPRARFWQWVMDVPPSGEVTLEFSYVTILHADTWEQDLLLIPLLHLLSTGAFWDGPMERASGRVTLHGIDPDWLVALAHGSPSGEETLAWELTAEEPVEDRPLILALPAEAVAQARYGPAPYDVSGLPAHLQLMDAIVRFSRIPPATGEELAEARGNGDRRHAEAGAWADRRRESPAQTGAESAAVARWEDFLALLERTARWADPRSRWLASRTLQSVSDLLGEPWERFQAECFIEPLPAPGDPFAPLGFEDAHLSFGPELRTRAHEAAEACSRRRARWAQERQLFTGAVLIALFTALGIGAVNLHRRLGSTGALFAVGGAGAAAVYLAVLTLGTSGTVLALAVAPGMFVGSALWAPRRGWGLQLGAVLHAAPAGLLLGVAAGSVLDILRAARPDPAGVLLLGLGGGLAAALAALPASWRHGAAHSLGFIGGLAVPVMLWQLTSGAWSNLGLTLALAASFALAAATGCWVGERRSDRARALGPRPGLPPRAP